MRPQPWKREAGGAPEERRPATPRRHSSSLTAEIVRITEQERKTQRLAYGLTLFTLQTALAIVCLTDASVVLAADWAKDPMRRGAALDAEVEKDTIRKPLEDVVLAPTPEEIASWPARDSDVSREALAEATRVVRKRRLREAVQRYQGAQGTHP